MPDHRAQLQGLYTPATAFDNFGEMLASVAVYGFRCHQSTRIEFQSPVTAIAGLNGTGKSTLLQLASTAYRRPGGRYYVCNYVITGTLDTSPISPDAYVVFEYWKQPPTHPPYKHKTVAVTRRRSRWSGYSRQPGRAVFFAGVSHSLPKVEERDLVTVFARTLTVNSTDEFSLSLRTSVGRILGTSYDQARQNHVTARGRSRDIVSVERGGSAYSEINMGFGEARIHRLLSDISKLPERSLILLEEPEISLHPSAQHELGRFLVELCIEKRHQVILTTHSESLLRALPEKSRIYLVRTADGVKILPCVSVDQAASLLADQFRPSLRVLVEDEVAEHIVTELLRQADPIFLKTIRFAQIGGSHEVQLVTKALIDMGVRSCAVRDADKGDNVRNNLFKLPGRLPPEREIFASASFRAAVLARHGVNIGDFELQLIGRDHHDWLRALSDKIPCNREAFLQFAAVAYLEGVPSADKTALIGQIKAVLV